MSRALIGHTGFVGGNLARQAPFDAVYNSSNIESLKGQRHSLLVCAGAPAVKWLANKEPEADLRSIEQLRSALGLAQLDEVVLISTVDVYPRPFEVDEDTPISPTDQQPYGKHRLLLEDFVLERFPKATVVRLPALFGPGLKKNIVYDFLHQNRLEQIDSEAEFQWYDLANLWRDIEKVRELGVRRVNLATEPIRTAALVKEAFGLSFEQRLSPSPPRYDYRSKYAGAWGESDYQYRAAAVLGALKAFVTAERERLGR